jgi:hypothetical protein
MRRSLRWASAIVVLAAFSVVGPAGGSSTGALEPCALPARAPLWIDYGESSLKPDVRAVFARPGIVVSTSGTAAPAEFRRAGAITTYFVRGLPAFVGQPATPADPDSITGAAARMLAQAQTSSACATPLIALNELLGSNARAPWTPTTAQYRANVLQLVQLLAQGGAQPALLVHGDPNVDGAAADWWREVARSAQIVYEAYYDAPHMTELGPVMANRRMRLGIRNFASMYEGIGITPNRLGIMLGFHSAQTPGIAGRQGLQPREAWFRVVKWEALTARQTATELHLATVWSWGWGTFGPESVDPDKADAACVYLWTRDAGLCDAPAVVGDAFDTSRAEGQLVMPAAAACTFQDGSISESAVDRLAALTGDRQTALSAQFIRAALRRVAPVGADEVLAQELRSINSAFHGKRQAYLNALRRRHATVTTARGVIADELRRQALAVRLAHDAVAQTAFGWAIERESQLATTATCRGDVLPGTGDFPTSDAREVGVVPLPSLLPFLFRDRTPPRRPAAPTVAIDGPHVTISWTPGREPDLAGYDVYRSTAGGAYTKLNEWPLQRVIELDAAPPIGQTVGYEIRAVDTSGNRSELSPRTDIVGS